MKLALSAFALAPAAIVLAAPAAQSQVDQLSKVAAHMQAVSTMAASFSQTDRKGGVLAGTLLMKRPGHIRFEYQKGVDLLIVGDGKSLNVIDYQVRQVQRWPIGNSPLSALLNPGQDVRKYGKLAAGSNDDVISVEVRDPKRPEYGMMTMVFVKQAGAPGGYTLSGWVALDSKNNRTSVRLSNVKYNVALANARFTWRDPRPVKRK